MPSTSCCLLKCACFACCMLQVAFYHQFDRNSTERSGMVQPGERNCLVLYLDSYDPVSYHSTQMPDSQQVPRLLSLPS
jgi:hypothetical protein